MTFLASEHTLSSRALRDALCRPLWRNGIRSSLRGCPRKGVEVRVLSRAPQQTCMINGHTGLFSREHGGLAQRQSSAFTRQRSLVQIQYPLPMIERTQPCYGLGSLFILLCSHHSMQPITNLGPHCIDAYSVSIMRGWQRNGIAVLSHTF